MGEWAGFLLPCTAPTELLTKSHLQKLSCWRCASLNQFSDRVCSFWMVETSLFTLKARRCYLYLLRNNKHGSLCHHFCSHFSQVNHHLTAHGGWILISILWVPPGQNQGIKYGLFTLHWQDACYIAAYTESVWNVNLHFFDNINVL